ncbi:uncharacterized protein [Solanum lycopersicum]|uniref:uncharacterized protein n=1 Tax=Solanum lycopersicum TaxID=4081 RepID=UPI00374A2E33
MKDGKDRRKNKDGNSKGCWTCGGPHLAKSCPNQQNVNALPDGNMNQKEEDEQIVAAMANPLGLSFNHITGINNIGEMSRVTHTFVDVRMPTKLGVKFTKSPSYFKTINAKAHAIVGMAYGVSMSTGSWVGKHNLILMPLGEFEIILGIDFLRKFQFVPFPHLDGVIVMNGNNVGFIKGVHPFGNINKVAKKKDKGMILSAMSIDKGLKKGDDTILVALVEVKCDVTMEVPDCVAELLKQYADVKPPELPKKLPPRRAIDHKIELLACTVAPAQAPYRMAPKELVKLHKQLNELLDARLIQPSKAPYGVPILFQNKQDGTMQMCLDYRALNKATIKNKYPVPLVHDLTDTLSKACWFTKLDLREGYWQVRIVEGDEPKTTSVTRYGSYEFLVMPFRLTNAPATFCNLMNNVLFDYVDDIVVVYIDDIFIYSRTLEEHINHLSLVLSQLRKYTLYVKIEKCEFDQEEIKFFGHLVTKNQVRMDPKKVQDIVDWQAPRHVKGLRSFHVLANYYRKFIAAYSKRVAALTDLLKKDIKWNAIASEPILKFPDFVLPFEVHTDASHKEIGGILVQEGHPVAFKSRKLNNDEQLYSTHEKEMVAVIHCLQNQVVFANDSLYVKWMGQVQDGTMRRYWIKDDLLYLKGERIVVPNQAVAADLFYNFVVKYFGIPAYIVSDRDTRFTGRQPITPLDVAKSKNQGKCLAAYRVARDRLEMLSEAQDSLRKAQRRMKKYADQHRRSVEFNVGDKMIRTETGQTGLLHQYLHSMMLKLRRSLITGFWSQRIGGRSVSDDAMEAFAECYPLRDSAAYQYKTSPAFSETVDDDDLTSDDEMNEEEKNDALDEANALMMFDRGDDEH